MPSLTRPKSLQHYTFALFTTAIILIVAVLFGGGKVILPITALALIEITFSFENAVINSQILGTMNAIWQRIFLTVGIAIAVFGVRLFLPLALVSSTTGHTIGSIFDMALHQPDIYAEHLTDAYPVIAAFGGVFLLMIGLRFFAERKEVTWLGNIEDPLNGFNRPWWISISGAIVAIAVIRLFLAPDSKRTMVAAILGALTFITVKLLGGLLMSGLGQKKSHQAGSHHHGMMQFIYLELLDASFSFDGVIAAFAITKDVLLIAAGLGIGAMYVRSMTVHLLKSGTLTQYRYLVHGSHYAILSLSLLLLIGIKYEIPDVVTGILGLMIIGVAFQSSRRYNHQQASS